jgi:hypothetical protein
MISRQKHNEALRKVRRERAKYVRDKYLEYGVRSNVEFKPVPDSLSEEERLAIRKHVRNDFRKSRRWSILTFIFAVLLLGFVCFLILNRF